MDILHVCSSVLSFATPLLPLCTYMGLDLDELAMTPGRITRKLCNNCVHIMDYEGNNCSLFHYNSCDVQ